MTRGGVYPARGQPWARANRVSRVVLNSKDTRPSDDPAERSWNGGGEEGAAGGCRCLVAYHPVSYHLLCPSAGGGGGGGWG